MITGFQQSYMSYIPEFLHSRARQYFAYEAHSLPLAAAAADVDAFALNNDAHFLLTAITGTARDPAAPTTRFLAPAVTLNLNDDSSGRNVFQAPMDWVNVVGTGERPFYMPYPYWIKKAGTITVDFQSLALAGGQAYNLRLTFHGFKIFTFDQSLSHLGEG